MARAWLWVTKILLMLLVTTLVGGFAGAALARYAPGYGVDERELDTRLSSASIQQIRQSNAQSENLVVFYLHYLARMWHGDLGYSLALERPIRELLAERLPDTAKSVAVGLTFAWTLGLGLASAVVLWRISSLDLLASLAAGFVVCIPPGLLALGFFFARAPARLAIGVIVFPKIFRYTRNVLLRSWGEPYVIAARAKGLSEIRVFVAHVLPASAAQVLSLAGVSVSLALSAAIPVEVLCSLPGIGQLAWQAAMARDFYLLVNLTMVITAVTLVANSTPDLLRSGSRS